MASLNTLYADVTGLTHFDVEAMIAAAKADGTTESLYKKLMWSIKEGVIRTNGATAKRIAQLIDNINSELNPSSEIKIETEVDFGSDD